MNKFFVRLIVFGFGFFFLASFQTDHQPVWAEMYRKDSTAIQSAESKDKIGICYTWFGPSDQSMNSMVYNGAVLIEAKYKANLVYRTPSAHTVEAYQNTMRDLIVKQHVKLIIAPSIIYKRAIDGIASLFPQTHFVLLDVVAKEAQNVTSVLFAQHEGSFTVGVLAARMTTSKKIGFIGGVDVNVVKAFLQGFREGIDYIDPSINLRVEYISHVPDFSGFASPEKGLAAANKMYATDIDIIYSVAGGTGNGVIHAAKLNKKYVIGVDSDQDHMAPGFVLTSMMKRWDRSIEWVYQKYLAGELSGIRSYEMSYKDGGVGITDLKYTRNKIPNDVLAEVLDIEQKISNGSIVVNNYLKTASQ